MTASDESLGSVPPIDPTTRLGHVHYTVASLERQVAFYQTLGFHLHWRTETQAGLGAGAADLLRLTEVAGARPVQQTTGLYHTAFNVTTRWELAHLLKRIAERRLPMQGASDHGTHLALYLPDAEGNGIELAWDYPEPQWPKSFREMFQRNRALDIDALLMALTERSGAWSGVGPETRVGHVHLHVAHLGPTDRFYRGVLGFGIPFDMTGAPAAFAETAIFFAAGGYHHHIGTNIWQGAGAPPPPAHATGLRYFTVVLPTPAALERVATQIRAADIATEATKDGLLVHDASRNGVLLQVAG